MEEDELALSDVHIDLSSSNRLFNDAHELKYPAYITEFRFEKPATWHETKDIECFVERTETETNDYDLLQTGRPNAVGFLTQDEDGDMIVTRRPKFEVLIHIEHTLSTKLRDVGLQVWQGCLYLCDFIIHSRELFRDAVVVELGGGVGLASIVASMLARQVICTDVGRELLEVCWRNVIANAGDRLANIIVRELDWRSSQLLRGGGSFMWNQEDEELLRSCHIIIAADVIYSDDLTDALLKSIRGIMADNLANRTLIFAVERRLNFTLEDLEVACPAYDYFRRCLENFCETVGDSRWRFDARLVKDVPQYFVYDRSRYLELWLVQSTCVNVTDS